MQFLIMLNKKNLKAPELDEFYPKNLIKEFPEVEVEPIVKPAKLRPQKTSTKILNKAADNFYKWN